MYIKKIEIKNIRSISEFTMEFPEGKEAGWHVLIGDNGAGKSTIVRSASAVLIGPEEIGSVRQFWEEWLSQGQDSGTITLELVYDPKYDKTDHTPSPKEKVITNAFQLKRNSRVHMESNINAKSMNPKKFNWGNNNGWFSVAYGPFRRFTGGNPEWNKVYYAAPKAGAHLSVFGEDIALTEALEWLKDLDRRRLKEIEFKAQDQTRETTTEYRSDADIIFHGLRQFINQSRLLPHNATFNGVSLDGNPEFLDGNGNIIKVTQMSDGYRSILSLTFELIRQLVQVYGARSVFEGINPQKPHFKQCGVVLIDEIDAHLHPTWQTRIGQWFTEYFPGLQFIVTTHSPLICRACEKGTIWRLAAPGSEQESGEVTGIQRDRLIFGNVLDAYGTQVFGADTSRSDTGNEKMKRLAELNIKSITGKISKNEEAEYQELQAIFPTGK